jgi:chromosome segregation ATPase
MIFRREMSELIKAQATPTGSDSFEKPAETQINGNGSVNGHTAPLAESQEGIDLKARPTEALVDSVESNAEDNTDASSRLEAMSQDREALRSEVEQLRKSLEDIQGKHSEDISAVRAELEESEAARDQAQTQYQNLLGRVNTIKSTLQERMAGERRELAEAKDQIEEFEAQNESLKSNTQTLEAEVSRLDNELQENSKELSSLRNRHNLSQQNWLNEREDLLQQSKHLKEEAEAAKEAMGDWEVLAMEERSIREGLAERLAELEDQLTAHKEAYETAALERDSQSQAVDGLQRALQDIQEARKVELREMVETTDSKIDALNKHVQKAEARATEAESAKELLAKELERAAPFEMEVKEKNQLIGKLRHDCIIMNDHLSKALRFLKKAKPEDNVDRLVHPFIFQPNY